MSNLPRRRMRVPAYRSLQVVFRETFQSIGSRPRLWRMREAAHHVFRLLRNAADRQEVQVLIDRANQLFFLIPVPRYPARYHVINPPFRSSARSRLRNPRHGF